MDKIFNGKVKIIIGVVAIAITFVIGLITKFSYSSNAVMTIIMSVAMLTFANMLISKIFKLNISYILYMLGNIVGIFIAMFILSKSEAMSSIYTIMFLVIMFVVLWIYHMCIMDMEGVGKRVFASFAGTVCSVIFVALGTFIVITISVVLAIV